MFLFFDTFASLCDRSNSDVLEEIFTQAKMTFNSSVNCGYFAEFWQLFMSGLFWISPNQLSIESLLLNLIVKMVLSNKKEAHSLTILPINPILTGPLTSNILTGGTSQALHFFSKMAHANRQESIYYWYLNHFSPFKPLNSNLLQFFQKL